jgi:hypothetical protein
VACSECMCLRKLTLRWNLAPREAGRPCSLLGGWPRLLRAVSCLLICSVPCCVAPANTLPQWGPLLKATEVRLAPPVQAVDASADHTTLCCMLLVAAWVSGHLLACETDPALCKPLWGPHSRCNINTPEPVARSTQATSALWYRPCRTVPAHCVLPGPFLAKHHRECCNPSPSGTQALPPGVPLQLS